MSAGARPAIGISEFREIRETGRLYVDKSKLISLIVRDAGKALLFPRPRRFGKTLNMSMLRCFFEKTATPAADETRAIFEGLQVASDPTAQEHFARYPTIALSCKDIHSRDYADMLVGVSEEIRRVYGDHRYLIEHLPAERGQRFNELLSGTCRTEEILRRALADLSADLNAYHRERCLVLIDEYDTPLQHAYIRGYYDDAVDFFRGFYSTVLKDNDRNLFRGVLTGILRVAREGIFSGLNNIKVCSLLEEAYADCFGFTENEVASLVAGDLDEIRNWYDGYRFGGARIYNPWSILSYIDSHRLAPHWVNTGDNELIRRLLVDQGLGFTAELEDLLEKRTITQRIDENLVLRDIDSTPHALWTFLLFSGYLRANDIRFEGGVAIAELAIPNLEVELVYRDIFKTWANQGSKVRSLAGFRDALLAGDFEKLEHMIRRLSIETLSFHDAAGHPPESFYHGFVIGLLLTLGDDYQVRSNSETGYGRADVLLIPREKRLPGAVLELKVLRPQETSDEGLARALEQIERKAYATELRASGIEVVHEVAVVFRGKDAWVKRREEKPAQTLLGINALTDPNLAELQRTPLDLELWRRAISQIDQLTVPTKSVRLRIQAPYGIAFSVGRRLATIDLEALEIDQRSDGDSWVCVYRSRDTRPPGTPVLGVPELLGQRHDGAAVVVGIDGHSRVNRAALVELAARVRAKAAYVLPLLLDSGAVENTRQGAAIIAEAIDVFRWIESSENARAIYFVTRLPVALVAALGFRYPFGALPRVTLSEYDPDAGTYRSTVTHTRAGVEIEGGG